jgi:hypothetical protein
MGAVTVVTHFDGKLARLRIGAAVGIFILAALGDSQTLTLPPAISALRRKADIENWDFHVHL